MADDATSTMIACRGQEVNGALKAIERVFFATQMSQMNVESLVVIVSANFADGHGKILHWAKGEE